MTSIEKILVVDYMYYSHLNQGWLIEITFTRNHPRIRTFTHHIENSHPMGWKFSPNTVETVIRHTYYTSENSHILQWKTSPQRVRNFTHDWQLLPTTVRLSPANLNFHSSHFIENSHPTLWELSPARVRTLTFNEKNDFFPCWPLACPVVLPASPPFCAARQPAENSCFSFDNTALQPSVKCYPYHQHRVLLPV